jgi:Fe-S-cluster containining protein
MTSVLTDYRRLLGEVEAWFASCLAVAGPDLACRRGCSACCKALFDITLLDAWLLRESFADLQAEVQSAVLNRCQPRFTELCKRWPQLKHPYFLNALPEEEWTDMPEDDQIPCPLLDDNGHCLVYAARPLTCRLHGLPHIDFTGEDFEGVVCTLHRGDPFNLPEQVLRWRFRQAFAEEVALSRAFAKMLSGNLWQELDTFIPLALLADYSSIDWKNLQL